MTGAPPTIAGICNRALGHVEHNKRIADLTDGTDEADEAGLHWDAARRQVLSQVNWHFALELQDLTSALSGEISADARPYVYQLGPEVLKVVSLVDVDLQDYIVMNQRNHLHTCHGPPLKIMARIDIADPARFEPEFVTALEMLLAAKFAPRFSRSQNRAEIWYKRYDKYIEEFMASEAAEGGDVSWDQGDVTLWRDLVTSTTGIY